MSVSKKSTSKAPKTKMLAVRFPSKLVDEIEALAEKNNAYKSEVVIELVRTALASVAKNPAKSFSVLD